MIKRQLFMHNDIDDNIDNALQNDYNSNGRMICNE